MLDFNLSKAGLNNLFMSCGDVWHCLLFAEKASCNLFLSTWSHYLISHAL